jgi:fatty acid amide hydrolase 2
MSPERILRSSAVALGRAIRRREVTARQVVDAHIGRIRRVNPTINAVVKDRFDDALREASLADETTASVHPDDLPPFHGIPFTTKDALGAAGMPNTSGLWARRDVLAVEDATAVKRLKEAGAILLGVTNISELCMWMESDNKVWGRTNNPYDPTRTAGGSSGGEGAIVGAGGSVLGLGSDVGGSIRMPAFFNGAFGHKPTGGLVPSTGHYPPAERLHQRYVTTGPIVRRAEDLMPFLRVVAGPDGIERYNVEPRLGDPAHVDLSKITAWVVPDNGLFTVDERMASAQERAARALEAAGARIERRRIPALKRSAEIWSAMLHEGGGDKSFEELMAAGGELRPLLEIGKAALGRSSYTLPGLLLCLIERVPGMLSERTRRSIELGRELRAELEEMLGDDGVMLFPSYPTPAPKHHAPLLIPFKWIYTAIFNVMEMPVTQVPMGLDERGVPLGVQVAAGNCHDTLTIAVALELERQVGGWTPPARWPL